METIKKIIEWSEFAFPDATLDGQIDKFNTEYEEYFNADNNCDRLKELADVFIVAFSISRFDIGDGLYYIDDAWQLYSNSPFSLDEVVEAIENKMAVNRQRKWKKQNGQYQHEDN